MSATQMRTTVEGILSSRENRTNAFKGTVDAVKGLKGDVRTSLKGYRQALANEGARQRKGLKALRSELRAGHATLRDEVQGSLAHLKEDFSQTRSEWQRTARGQTPAASIGRKDYSAPPGRPHQQRAKRQA
jgi:hypothetical protein